MSGVNYNDTTNKAADQAGNVPAGSVDLAVNSYTLPSDFSTASITFVDTGMTVSFTTTKTNEQVIISLIGFAYVAIGASGTATYAIKFDSDADQIITSISANSGIAVNICFSQAFVVATPGAHTVKLRLKGQVGETWRINGTGATGQAKLQVFQVQ